MNKKFSLSLVICCTLGVGLANAEPFEKSFEQHYLSIAKDNTIVRKNEKKPYYIKYKNAKVNNLNSSVQRMGLEVHYQSRTSGYIVSSLTQGEIEELQADSSNEIEFIEPVPRERLANFGGDFVPYNIEQLNVQDLWDVNKDGFVDEDAIAGEGIRVCIIDSGLDTSHDEFRQLADAGKITGTTFSEQLPWDEDPIGHGTHVAGTILSSENNRGVLGGAPKVNSLHIVRYIDENGVGVPYGLSAAIESCVEAGANIINMSIYSHFSRINEAASQKAYDAGILLVASAGNSGTESATAKYPAGYKSVISVGAINREQQATDFTSTVPTKLDPNNPSHTDSEHGWDFVELAAGGYQVMSSFPDANGGGISKISLKVKHNDDFYVYFPAGAFVAKEKVKGKLLDGGSCLESKPAWNNAIILCARENISDHSEAKKVFVNTLSQAKSAGAKAVLSFDKTYGAYRPNCLSSAGSSDCPKIPVLHLYNLSGQQLLTNYLNEIAEVEANDGSLNCETGIGTCRGAYRTMSGTSMAAPTVVGGAATLWSECGGPINGVTNKQLRQLLRSGAKDLIGRQPAETVFAKEPGSFVTDYGIGYDKVTGWGLPQIEQSLKKAEELGLTACSKPKISISSKDIRTCSGIPVSLDIDLQWSGSPYNFKLEGESTTAKYAFIPNNNGSKLIFHESTAGDYKLKVIADRKGQRFATHTNVNVLPVTIEAPEVKYPLDGKKVDPNGILTWTKVNGAKSYQVIIARDSSFKDNVQTFEVSEASFKLEDAYLELAEEYFWKVMAISECGFSNAVSETNSFYVDTRFCIAPVSIIKNNSTDRTLSSIDINTSDNKIIKALTVDLVAQAWPTGGVIAELIHSSSNSTEDSVLLVDKPGIGSNSSNEDLGCEDAYIRVRFDDNSTYPIEDACPTYGRLKPEESFSDFLGKPMKGKWTLSIASTKNNPYIEFYSDNQIARWCIDAELEDLEE